MKSSIALALLFMIFGHMARAADQVTHRSEKGFFSVGGFYGAGASRFLNTDGSFADYKTTSYGVMLDILLWDAGTGDIRMFGRHIITDGESNSTGSDTLSASETVAGLKFYAGNHLYLGGSMGTGQAKLKSPSRGTDLTLSYELMRASLGLNFALTETLFVALEADYKEAPLKKSKNSGLAENSFFEGMGVTLNLIWSPPSVQVNVTPK